MQKLLVANRGEIALRIMRTAREMRIRTVVVFSDADRLAPHVRYANEASRVGAFPSSDSYLCQEKILKAAEASRTNAVCPGYGFLSENADFASMVRDTGMRFVSPLPRSIEMMGDKLAAKRAVERFGIPLVPGVDRLIQDID